MDEPLLVGEETLDAEELLDEEEELLTDDDELLTEEDELLLTEVAADLLVEGAEV